MYCNIACTGDVGAYAKLTRAGSSCDGVSRADIRSHCTKKRSGSKATDKTTVERSASLSPKYVRNLLLRFPRTLCQSASVVSPEIVFPSDTKDSNAAWQSGPNI